MLSAAASAGGRPRAASAGGRPRAAWRVAVAAPPLPGPRRASSSSSPAGEAATRPQGVSGGASAVIVGAAAEAAYEGPLRRRPQGATTTSSPLRSSIICPAPTAARSGKGRPHTRRKPPVGGAMRGARLALGEFPTCSPLPRLHTDSSSSRIPSIPSSSISRKTTTSSSRRTARRLARTPPCPRRRPPSLSCRRLPRPATCPSLLPSRCCQSPSRLRACATACAPTRGST